MQDSVSLHMSFDYSIKINKNKKKMMIWYKIDYVRFFVRSDLEKYLNDVIISVIIAYLL